MYLRSFPSPLPPPVKMEVEASICLWRTFPVFDLTNEDGWRRSSEVNWRQLTWLRGMKFLSYKVITRSPKCSLGRQKWLICYISYCEMFHVGNKPKQTSPLPSATKWTKTVHWGVSGIQHNRKWKELDQWEKERKRAREACKSTAASINNGMLSICWRAELSHKALVALLPSPWW